MNARTVVAGALAGVVSAIASTALLIVYGNFARYAKVDYIDPRFTRGEAKFATILLVLLWCTVPLLAGIAFAHVLRVRAWLVCGVVALLLVVPMLYGTMVLSHVNACEGIGSFPLPGYWTFQGHECGR